MPGATLLTRVPRLHVKTITFTGATGLGMSATDITIGTVTGRIRILRGSAFCSTLLTSAGGGTLALGTTGNTGGIIAATTATDIDANEFWTDTTPELRISNAFVNLNISGNIIGTVATADITGGVIEFSFYWEPISVNGNMA